MAAVENEHGHVVQHLQGCDGVRAVVDCGAERGGGGCGHVVNSKGLVF